MTPIRFLAGFATVVAASTATAQLPSTSATFLGAGPVTVPFREVHNLVVIPVTINGHGPLQFILDTGAPVILVPDSVLASRLDLNIVGMANVGGAGDSAPVTAPLALGITARVGHLEVKDAVGVIGVAAAVIPGVDGVIGGAFLRHAAVEIDWDRRTVTFHDPSSGTLTATGDTIPLRVEPSLHSYIPGSVGVGTTTRSVDLHLDTGSRQALSLAPATVDAFPVQPDSSIPGIVGFGSRGAARGRFIRTATLKLGSTTLRGVTTTVPNQEPTGEARVGLPVLRRFHVVVDYPGQRLILRPRANLAEPFPFNTTGILLHPGKDSVHRAIADVMPGSPAAMAGLVAGDTVVAVGGTDARQLSEDEVDRSVLKPAPASLVRLTVRRRGQRIDASLTARTLLP